MRPLGGSVPGKQIDAQLEGDPQCEACSKEQRDVFKQVVAIFLVQQRLLVGHDQQAQGNDRQANDVQRADTNAQVTKSGMPGNDQINGVTRIKSMNHLCIGS